MKEYILLIKVFLIIWVCATAFCFMLGMILARAVFMDWGHNIFLGFSCAFWGVFGPVIYDKLFKKR